VGDYPIGYSGYIYTKEGNTIDSIPDWVNRSGYNFFQTHPYYCDWEVGGMRCPHPEKPDVIYNIDVWSYANQRDNVSNTSDAPTDMIDFSVQYNINQLRSAEINNWYHDKIEELYTSALPPQTIWQGLWTSSYFSMLYFPDGVNLADIEYWEIS
jgi:hypothetical protein